MIDAQIFLTWSAFWLVSVGSSVWAAAPVTESRVLSGFSLEQLDSASNLLLWAIEAGASSKMEKTAGLYCGIRESEARVLLQAIHPLIDRKMDQYIARRIEAKTGNQDSLRFGKSSWKKGCQKGCHCGFYATLLERVGSERLSKADQKLLNDVLNKTRSLPHERMESCLAQTRWFCASELLAYLRQSSPQFEVKESDPGSGK